MDYYDLHLLQRVIFGVDSLDRLGECSSDLSANLALIVTDEKLKSVGYLDRALSSLRKVSLDAVVFDAVSEDPTLDDIERGVIFAKESQEIDLIIGLGGGSPMDCAKGINFVVTNGGKIEDYVGMNDFAAPLLPSIGIPTTAGTGSEAQSYAVIADTDTRRKRAYGGRNGRFDTVLLDPSLSSSMPKTLTANSGIDAISHALESYVSKRRSVISQMLSRAAWEKLYLSFERVLSESQDLQARGEMLWGSHFAGAAIENSMLGAAHAAANPLTARYGLTHGSAVGLMLPHVIRMNGPVCGSLYSELVKTVGLEEAHRPEITLSNWLHRTMELAGLPLRLRDCSVDREVLPSLAREAADQWTGKFNPRPVAEDEFLELYEEAH